MRPLLFRQALEYWFDHLTRRTRLAGEERDRSFVALEKVVERRGVGDDVHRRREGVRRLSWLYSLSRSPRTCLRLRGHGLEDGCGELLIRGSWSGWCGL